MAYQSPYKLLSGLIGNPTSTIDEEMIIRLRKKLLAEFNLQNSVTIRINNHDYTKDEVLKLIDELKGIRNADIHLKIYSEPEVLKFLEDPIVNIRSDQKVFEWLNEPNVPTDLAILLREAVVEKLRHLFAKRLYANLLVVATSIYEGKDQELKLKFDELLFKYHHNTLSLITEATRSNISILPVHLHWLYELSWAKFYNYLHGFHPHLINELVCDCINLTVTLHRNSFNRKSLLRISSNMLFLQSDGENKRIAIDNHSVFMGGNSRAGGNNYWVVFVFIFFLFAILKACFNYSNKPKFDFKNYKIPNIRYDSNMFRPREYKDSVVMPKQDKVKHKLPR